MNGYLKIIFGFIFTAALFAMPARAQMDATQAAPTQSASPPTAFTGASSPGQQPPAPDSAGGSGQPQAEATAPTPAQTAAAQDAIQNAPVQADTVQTDHAQKPTKEVHYYNYAHDEAEYSVSLPDAPTVSTIWMENNDTKAFLRRPPTDHAALGELGVFKLVDIDTEEIFDVQITFLRATPSFLQGLTDQKIKHMLMKKFSEVALSNETFNISDGSGTLKWATLSGFVLDSHHHPAFYALHYLTGLQSILVVQVKYSIENKTFQEYYNHLVNSITYVQP